MTTDPTPDIAALTARIAAKKAEPAFRDAAKILEAPVPLGIVQAQTLREAATEIATMDPAEAALAGQYAFHNAAAELHRRANEAEFVATPCDPMVACEDGGEPCHTHERLMSHYDGSHELCEPGCAAPAVPSVPAVDQTTRDRIAEAPAVWIDGHPQLEAIAAAVWERCRTEDTSLVVDDPRNIAVAAFAAVLRVLPSTADWDGLVREADRLRREGAALDERAAEVEARVAEFAATMSEPDGHTTNRAAVLLETAAFYDQLLADMGSAVECDPRYWQAIRRVATELRGKAAEAPQPACPDPIECSHEAALGEAEAEAERQLAAVQRVRRVLEVEPVLNRSALEYRGLILDALMGNQPAAVVPAAGAGQDETQTPCGPAPDQCDTDGEPCATHERKQAHAEGEHAFCGPECGKAEPTVEETVRNHVTTLHLIGEQLATVESWFWNHLADVRYAAASAVPGRSAATSTDEETRS